MGSLCPYKPNSHKKRHLMNRALEWKLVRLLLLYKASVLFSFSIISSKSQSLMALQWLTLIAAIWLQAINGTNSNFPAYSSELKKLLKISQLELNNLAAASDAGKLFGWISGMTAAHLPLWIVLLIGSLIGLIGYGVQFLFLTEQIPALSYWQMFLLTVLAGNSICWINTVCYIIAIKNFPLDRQIAVGLSTSYVGLSAKIYTDIVDVIPSKSAKFFLLLNATVPVILCIIVSPLVREINFGKPKKLTRGFFFLFIITVFTGAFAVLTSLGSRGSKLLPQCAILAGVSVFLLLPLVVPLAEKVGEIRHQKMLDECVNRNSSNSVENVEKSGEEDEFCFVETGVVQELAAKEMVKTFEFWLYFLVYLFGGTLGLVYLNNLGQIAESRRCRGTDALVSLSSAFGFFGRLLPSLVDYFLPKYKNKFTRSGAMGVMMVPLCGAFFLLMDTQDITLYASTAVIGICTGAITSISVSATTELFGTKNFGVNHNIVISNIPIGSFLFGDFAALLYKRYISHAEDCFGSNCYQTTFIVWGGLSLVGTFLAFILHLRTRKLFDMNRA